MPEGGAHLARGRRGGKKLGLLPSCIFEGLCVKTLGEWLGDRVPSHVEVAEAQLTTGSVACEEVAGTLHTLDEDLGQCLARLIVYGEALEPLTLVQPVLHYLAG